MPVTIEDQGYNRPVYDPASNEPIGPYAVFYREADKPRQGYGFQSARNRNEAARIWLELVSQGYVVLDIAHMLKVTIAVEPEGVPGPESDDGGGNGRSCHIALTADGRIAAAILDSFKYRDTVTARIMGWIDQGFTVEKRPLKSVRGVFPEDRIELLKRG